MNVTTEAPHYNPENGAYDGQLVHPDLVAQQPPPTAPEHPTPNLDNTFWGLFKWCMDLDIPHGPRLALLTILRHINWEKGDHCTAGIQTLAREAQFSRKTLKAHIKYLVGENLISRFRQIGRTTETRLGTVGVETTPMVGVETTPMAGVAATPETNSSSTNSIKPIVTPDQTANPEQEGPGLETKDQDGRTGSLSFLEEEGTETTPTPLTPLPADERIARAQEWIDANIHEVPTDAQIEGMLAYCWPVWEYPAHKDGWTRGIKAAIKHCTKDFKERKKFRVDLVEHLAKKGPPPTDADGQFLKREVWCEAGKHFTKTPVGATMEDKGNGRWFSDQCSDHLLVQV